MQKLNLGGGRKWSMEGWENLEYAHVYDLDLNLLRGYADDSVNLIYASHSLEHLSFEKVALLLLDCRRILKPEGILRVICPDVNFMLGVEKMQTLIGWPWLIGKPEMVYKAHDHRSHFSSVSMSILFMCAGFREIQVMAWNSSRDQEFLIPVIRCPEEGVLTSGFSRGDDSNSFILEAIK